MTSKSKRQTKRFAGIMTVFLLLAQMGAFAQFQNMKPVDINNDGRADLIDVYNNNGNAEIRVRLSTNTGFDRKSSKLDPINWKMDSRTTRLGIDLR